jgi:asparagine synthase (glutamine-hydrolysing)
VAAAAPVLSYSGRIDDRELLLAGSPPAESHASDEELLLARYQRLGERFLDDVRGSYAVAVYDPAAGRVIAARDAMGGRLASYVLRDDLFACAVGSGGVRRLLELPGVSDDLDRFRLAEYFAFDEVSGPSSYFRNVHHVVPGEILIVDRNSVRRRWLPGPSLSLRIDPATWEEGVERFAEVLATAVERAIGGHRRLAVWVSGGLDSTPVAALAARLQAVRGPSATIQGISWRIRDAAGDERSFVDAFARASGVPLSWVDCDDAMPFSNLADWPIHPDGPDQTGYRWFHERSYARARELGATLVLNGFGGDSLYADARRWLWTLMAANGPGVAIDRLREVARRDGWPPAVRREVVGALLPKRRRLRRPPQTWLSGEARELLAGRRPWPSGLLGARRPRQAERVLSLIDGEGDAAEAWYAARHGLEVSVPLRDQDLAQYVLAVPDHMLQQGVESRIVLRHAIRGLVPEEVRRRTDKARFREVLLRGLSPDRLRWSVPLLRSPQALWRGFVEPSAVDRWLAGDVRDDSDRVGLLQCLFAEIWRFTRAGGELAALAAGG